MLHRRWASHFGQIVAQLFREALQIELCFDETSCQQKTSLNFPRSMARMWGVLIVTMGASKLSQGSSLFRRTHGRHGFFRQKRAQQWAANGENIRS